MHSGGPQMLVVAVTSVALHVRSDENSRGGIRTGSGSDRVRGVKRTAEFYHESPLFVGQRRPGRYRFRF